MSTLMLLPLDTFLRRVIAWSVVGHIAVLVSIGLQSVSTYRFRISSGDLCMLDGRDRSRARTRIIVPEGTCRKVPSQGAREKDGQSQAPYSASISRKKMELRAAVHTSVGSTVSVRHPLKTSPAKPKRLRSERGTLASKEKSLSAVGAVRSSAVKKAIKNSSVAPLHKTSPSVRPPKKSVTPVVAHDAKSSQNTARSIADTKNVKSADELNLQKGGAIEFPLIEPPLQGGTSTVVSEVITVQLESAADGSADTVSEKIVRDMLASIRLAWRPPCGVRVAHPAIVRIVFDGKGEGLDITLVQSSHVPVFDHAVQRAARACKAPYALRNRVVEIAFT